jgi:uncharacterized protein YdeI (YjbR/CyaY-like superfamily)
MARKTLSRPRHFGSAAEFRRWLADHGASTKELWVGFYKKASGKGGLGYKDAVDEALCAGWIDGVKKRVDDERYTHRFSPRTASSIWSAVNLKRMKELIAAGRVTAAGLETYERRDPARADLYSYENRPKAFDAAATRAFKANSEAWAFFNAQPPGYRRLCVFFVMEAKKDSTRARRLETLIAASAKGKRMQWM